MVYRLSPQAQRVALLERESRPLDIRLGQVTMDAIAVYEPDSGETDQ